MAGRIFSDDTSVRIFNFDEIPVVNEMKPTQPVSSRISSSKMISYAPQGELS